MVKTNIFKLVFGRDYFKDRTTVLLFLIMSFVLLVNLIFVILSVNPTEEFVKTSFNGYGLGDFQRGSGYNQYAFGIFATISYVSVLALSIKTFNIRKSLSILQLYLGITVLVMLFFVSKAVIQA